MAVRVLVADNQKMVSDALTVVLDLQSGMDVVGVASSGTQVLSMVAECGPNILLLDASMPRMNGVAVTERVKKRNPSITVVGMTGYDAPLLARRMLAVGARGFVCKAAGVDTLVQAIRSADEGKIFLCKKAKMWVKDAEKGPRSAPRDIVPGQLTPRQSEVLTLVAKGKSSKEIAGILGVCERTIETHRNNLKTALGARTFAELYRYAVHFGLVHV